MTTRHLARVSSLVPEGWDVLETTELFGPGGVRVAITAQPCHHDIGTDAIAARHGELLETQLEGYQDGGAVSAISLSGCQVLRRDHLYGVPGDDRRASVVYLAHGGTAIVASATGPTAAFDEAGDTITEILDGTSVLGTPLAAPDDTRSPSAVPPTGGPRPPVPAETWHALRRLWLSGGGEIGRESSLVLTAEELLVAAACWGVGAVPTVDPLPFATLDIEVRDGISAAIARSLAARGHLRERDGVVEPTGVLAELLGGVLWPDLYVEVIAVDDDGDISARAAAVRPQSAVTIDTAGPGTRSLSTLAPGALATWLTEVVANGLRPSGGRVTVRSTWRDGNGLVATELSWTAGDPPRPDTVLAQLADRLPGALPDLSKRV